MTVIGENDGTSTRIELLRTGPGGQDATARGLGEANRVLAGEPGFVSVALHRSTDGGAVVNYLQWEAEAGDVPNVARSVLDGSAGEPDDHLYSTVHAHTIDGGLLEIREGFSKATIIDVILTTPEQQEGALRFALRNGRTFAEQPGYLATGVLRGHDGDRIGTYSQWESVDHWLAAVRAIQGENLPGLASVDTIEELNEVLQQSSEGQAAFPEYHAYEVVSVVSR